MQRAIGLILLGSVLAFAGGAQAQSDPIGDLIRRTAPPPPGVYISDPVVQPDGPPTAEDNAYENRVLSTFRSAQTAQGALDGRWEVRNANGAVLYILQLADPGAGPGRIEGVWRDPRKVGASSSGFVNSITVEGGDTIVMFQEEGASAATQVRLRSAGAARWSGQARAADGSSITVTMVRGASVESRALGGG